MRAAEWSEQRSADIGVADGTHLHAIYAAVVPFEVAVLDVLSERDGSFWHFDAHKCT